METGCARRRARSGRRQLCSRMRSRGALRLDQVERPVPWLAIDEVLVDHSCLELSIETADGVGIEILTPIHAAPDGLRHRTDGTGEMRRCGPQQHASRGNDRLVADVV